MCRFGCGVLTYTVQLWMLMGLPTSRLLACAAQRHFWIQTSACLEPVEHAQLCAKVRWVPRVPLNGTPSSAPSSQRNGGDAACKQKESFLFTSAGLGNIHNAHIRAWPWPQLLTILYVSSPNLGFICTSPSHCLCAYNSQIMSSSEMYSQCCVCIDLQAGLPLHPPMHTQPHSAPGTNRRLHLVSQTTKSVRCILALLLYSVIDGSENPPPPSLCVCVLVSN